MNEKCKECSSNYTCTCSVAFEDEKISEIKKKHGLCNGAGIGISPTCSNMYITNYKYEEYIVIDKIGTKDSRYLPFCVFVITDDIKTESDKRQFDLFTKKVRGSTHTVLIDPIRYFNDHPYITDNENLAKDIDAHDTNIYADIFDSLVASCDAIYYIKLYSEDNVRLSVIKEKLEAMYQDYLDKGYKNINKISIFTDINEIPFD